MKVIITKDYNEMSEVGTREVVNTIKQNKRAVIGLATGSTAIGVYNNLIKLYEEQQINFENIKTFNLDEYIGLNSSHSQSYRYFMNETLFNKINLKEENIYFLNGMASDLNEECLSFQKKLKDTPIDLQILGIGTNGHIAFIEPNTKLKLKTHQTRLTKSTIIANSRFFKNINQVPKQALTMGIGEIMSAKKILLMANGTKKAKAIQKMLNGKITTRHPASLLQLHPNVVVVIDEEAAKLLDKEYYSFV